MNYKELIKDTIKYLCILAIGFTVSAYLFDSLMPCIAAAGIYAGYKKCR